MSNIRFSAVLIPVLWMSAFPAPGAAAPKAGMSADGLAGSDALAESYGVTRSSAQVTPPLMARKPSGEKVRHAPPAGPGRSHSSAHTLPAGKKTTTR
jgi:hypothetical protein